MRSGAVIVLLVASLAHATEEHCKVERAEAELVPPSAEDVRAYHDCVEKWRAAEAMEAATREAARQAAEDEAQAPIEHARDLRERPLRDARGLVVLGSILVGTGGIVSTIAGGIGTAGLATQDPRSSDGSGIALGMGMLLGIAGGAIMIPGAVLLGLGARDHRRAKRAIAVDSVLSTR
jgi:hypothetical protein